MSGLLYRIPTREEAEPVLWKIVGVLLGVWLAFLIVGAIFKLVVPMLVVGAVILGSVMIYRAVTGAGDSKSLL